jgi:two-component system, NarL family, response regulator NreC
MMPLSRWSRPARTITLVLADDHNVMRSGLRMLLDAEADFAVLAEAADVPGAFRHVRNDRPDVLVLDLNMPGGSSIDAIRRLAPISPRTAVVVLTMEEDRAFVRGALDAGASGYVQKQAAGRELVRAAVGCPASPDPRLLSTAVYAVVVPASARALVLCSASMPRG